MASLQVIREQLEGAEGATPGVLRNVIDDLMDHSTPDQKETLKERRKGISDERADPTRLGQLRVELLQMVDELQNPPPVAPLAEARARAIADVQRRTAERIAQLRGQGRRSQTKRFGSCVKAVRKTVKARKGSNSESAAIAICTTTLLHPRGRTIKRYRKGRLVTQKRLKV